MVVYGYELAPETTTPTAAGIDGYIITAVGVAGSGSHSGDKSYTLYDRLTGEKKTVWAAASEVIKTGYSQHT